MPNAGWSSTFMYEVWLSPSIQSVRAGHGVCCDAARSRIRRDLPALRARTSYGSEDRRCWLPCGTPYTKCLLVYISFFVYLADHGRRMQRRKGRLLTPSFAFSTRSIGSAKTERAAASFGQHRGREEFPRARCTPLAEQVKFGALKAFTSMASATPRASPIATAKTSRALSSPATRRVHKPASKSRSP